MFKPSIHSCLRSSVRKYTIQWTIHNKCLLKSWHLVEQHLFYIYCIFFFFTNPRCSLNVPFICSAAITAQPINHNTVAVTDHFYTRMLCRNLIFLQFYFTYYFGQQFHSAKTIKGFYRPTKKKKNPLVFIEEGVSLSSWTERVAVFHIGAWLRRVSSFTPNRNPNK